MAPHASADQATGLDEPKGPILISYEDFDRTPTAMMVTDGTGKLQHVNRALVALLDQPAELLTTLSLRDLTDPRDAPELAARLQRMTDGEGTSIHLNLRLVRRNGDRIRRQMTGVAIRRFRARTVGLIIQLEVSAESQDTDDLFAHRGFHDELTELANSRLFTARLDAAMTDRRSHDGQVAVVVIDLDRFNQINDGVGHLGGDLTLIEVGRRLMEQARPGHTVARLDADEFAIVAPGVLTAREAVELASGISRRLNEPYWVAGNALHVGASIGMAWSPADNQGPASFMREARSGLINTKRSASGWIVAVDGASGASIEQRSLARDLPGAIEAGQITLAYQPIVDHVDRVCAVEAFARWNHPTLGMIPPNQFIALGEQTGLTGVLSQFLLNAAAAQAAAWAAQAMPVTVAVNFSAAQLGEPHLVWSMIAALEAAGVGPELLALDVTESSIVRGGGYEVSVALDLLHRRGVFVSVDDFGTGYSSAAQLRALPLDAIKIDRSLTTGISRNAHAARIVGSIVGLGRSLGLVTVAEGVEDRSTRTALEDLGCDRFQGFGIARPAAAEEVTPWLAGHTTIGPATPPPKREPRPLLILVIDDDRAIRGILRALLARNGHHVTAVESGREGITLCADHRPDLIVLDYMMPELNGVETIPLLRAAGFSGPIVMYTGVHPQDLVTMRLPLDVWPVSKADQETLLTLIEGYASRN